MPDEENRVSNAELKLELKDLGSQITDIKTLLVANEERIRCLERTGDKTTPITEKRLEILEKLTDAHAQELEDLKEIITTQAQSIEKLKDGFDDMQKIWKWALGILTTVMIAVIILFITGQAEVIFK